MYDSERSGSRLLRDRERTTQIGKSGYIPRSLYHCSELPNNIKHLVTDEYISKIPTFVEHLGICVEFIGLLLCCLSICVGFD